MRSRTIKDQREGLNRQKIAMAELVLRDRFTDLHAPLNFTRASSGALYQR
jgi:hypothetical protein